MASQPLITEQNSARCGTCAVVPELVTLVEQYRSDLRYPPANGSTERRLAAIDAALAKVAAA